MQEQKKGGSRIEGGGFQPTAAALQKDKEFTVTCKNTEGLSVAKILQFLLHYLHSVYGTLKFFSCSLENHMPFPLALYPRNSVVRRNESWYGTIGVLLQAALCHILDSSMRLSITAVLYVVNKVLILDRHLSPIPLLN